MNRMRNRHLSLCRQISVPLPSLNSIIRQSTRILEERHNILTLILRSTHSVLRQFGLTRSFASYKWLRQCWRWTQLAAETFFCLSLLSAPASVCVCLSVYVRIACIPCATLAFNLIITFVSQFYILPTGCSSATDKIKYINLHVFVWK